MLKSHSFYNLPTQSVVSCIEPDTLHDGPCRPFNLLDNLADD